MLCAYIKNSSFCLRAKNYLADEVCVSDTKCKWRSSCWFRRWANSILLFGGKGENAYKCLLGFPRRHLLFYGGKILNIIRNIIADYEKLIKTSIQIPLNNGDTISFTFHPQDLPHLLGLQHLVDNPILFEYSEKRLSATDL